MDIHEEQGGKAGRVVGHFGPAFNNIVGQMPGKKRWAKNGRDLLFEMTRANVEFLKQRFPGARWHTSRADEIALLNDMENDRKARAASGIAEIKNLPQEALMGFPFKMPPMEHQKESFILYGDAAYFGLFWEQGLGKTKGIIDLAAKKWMSGQIDTLLISAPNGVHNQWINEALRDHLPDEVPYMGYSYTTARTKKSQREFEDVFNFTGGLRVFSINFESTHATYGQPFVLDILNSGKVWWNVDESLRIKSPGAAVTKFHIKHRMKAAVRSILTGTPVGRGAEDLFTQLRFLHDDILGYTSFYSFKNHFCIEKQVPGAPLGAKKVVAYQNIDELRDKVSIYCSRRTAQECLDLSERIYIKRNVEFTPQQKKATDALKKEGITKLESGEVIAAPEAIVRLIRYQQILSGITVDIDGVPVSFPSNRINAAIDWVEEAADKVVIWARFHQDIDLLKDKLAKKGVVVWDGRCTSADKQEAKSRFIEDDSINVFLANQEAAGTGVDGLQYVCNKMLFYSNTFNASTRWQAEARLHRKGQKRPVFVSDLVTEGSIDTHIKSILELRKAIADHFIDGVDHDINSMMSGGANTSKWKDDEIAKQLYEAYLRDDDPETFQHKFQELMGN